jgi:hypothetical protein
MKIHARTDVHQGRVFVHLLFPDHPETNDTHIYSWSPQGNFRLMERRYAKDSFQASTEGEASACIKKYNERISNEKLTLTRFK